MSHDEDVCTARNILFAFLRPLDVKILFTGVFIRFQGTWQKSLGHNTSDGTKDLLVQYDAQNNRKLESN